MKPSEKWIDDWEIGLEPGRENQVAAGLVGYFVDFWDKEKLEEKSKKTRNRYGSALHALSGYLVEKAISKALPRRLAFRYPFKLSAMQMAANDLNESHSVRDERERRILTSPFFWLLHQFA